VRDIETVISLDMRAPSRAIPTQERYQAAVEMAVFVDAIGVDRTRLTEHHGSDDGYLPSRPSVIKIKNRPIPHSQRTSRKHRQIERPVVMAYRCWLCLARPGGQRPTRHATASRRSAQTLSAS